jgi:hypothetical protein
MADGKWRYRDYVVRSFNADKPFDRFLTEQFAGDELLDWRNAEKLTPEMSELLIATGFLRNAPDTTFAPELNTAVTRYQVLHDTIQIASSSVLGLTVACARCHSHKYDPISQHDYYRFLGFFTPALNPQEWQAPAERALPDVSPAEKAAIDAHNAALDSQVAELNKQLVQLRRPYELNLFELKLATVPEPIRVDTKAAIETPADKRNEIQRYLAEKFDASLKVKPAEIDAALSDADKAVLARVNDEVGTLNSKKRSFGRFQALVDVGPAPSTYLLRRGNYETPGPEVTPGFLSVLCDQSTAADSEPLHAATPRHAATTGRRRELARWLTDPDSRAAALVARVIVNRVWQHHFGQGLVATPDNFGRTGSPPTHPELLEWLASDFVDNGWRMKHLHYLIMTSATYRQGSTDRSHTNELHSEHQPTSVTHSTDVDPDNLLLWRQRLRRLESEAIRDSILMVSGNLDRTIGGPPIPLENKPDGSVVVGNQFRRSLYLLARRNYQPTLLAVFDQPILATNCTQRATSAVSLQSLTMLNDAFVLEQAERFARRVLSECAVLPQNFDSRRLFGPEPPLTGPSATLSSRDGHWYLHKRCIPALSQHPSPSPLPSLARGEGGRRPGEGCQLSSRYHFSDFEAKLECTDSVLACTSPAATQHEDEAVQHGTKLIMDRHIHRAFRIALAREATEIELGWAAELIGRQTERYLNQSSPKLTDAQAAEKALATVCHMLLNTNEFLYVH